MNEWHIAFQRLCRLMGYNSETAPAYCSRDARKRQEFVTAYLTAIDEQLIAPLEQLKPDEKQAIWKQACNHGPFLQQEERVDLSKIIHVVNELL